jgi:competence protein ComEA
MHLKKISIAFVIGALTAGGAFAQSKTTPPTTTPPTTTPAPPPSTSTTKMANPAPMASTTPSGAKVNLNTATAQQLDALPDVGKSRAKAIIAERSKGNFKDWADFDARTAHSSLNKGVKAKIKNLVTF